VVDKFHHLSIYWSPDTEESSDEPSTENTPATGKKALLALLGDGLLSVQPSLAS